MQSAKESVKSFIAKAGHHDTTIHETVAPAVKHEVVKPIKHEEVTTAVDREVHQDHYHRTVQPVLDREVLPERHEHNMAAVQQREFDHRDHDTTKQKLTEVASGFRDHRVVEETKHTQAAGAQIGGEHVHHHIHETIQPVVHKEVIQPSVVHTTVPIHEVHHKAATHHSTTELPPVSMTEFKNKGGALSGREERYDAFEGEPKNIGGVLGTGTGHSTSHTHMHDSHHTTGTGLTGSTTHSDRTGLTGSTGHSDRTGLTGSTGLTGNSGHADRTGLTGSSHHNTTSGIGGHHDTTDTTAQKPSLLQKLNPFSDADQDGKKGVME